MRICCRPWSRGRSWQSIYWRGRLTSVARARSLVWWSVRLIGVPVGPEIPDGRRFKSDRAHFYAYPYGGSFLSITEVS